MTISNREAMEQGKLGGGDVLELVVAKKAPGDTGEELGWNPAPGLVSVLLDARGGDYMDEDTLSFLRRRTARPPEPGPRCGREHNDVACCLDKDHVGTEHAWIDPKGRCFVWSAIDGQPDVVRYDGRTGLDIQARAEEKIANPLRVMTRVEAVMDGVHEIANQEDIDHLFGPGLVTLPTSASVEIFQCSWPNPASVEAGQMWGRCDSDDVALLVAEVDGDAVRWVNVTTCGHRLHSSAAYLLDPANGWRCVGYELPDGNRIMVGEYRQGEAGDGSSIWRVSQIRSGAEVLIASPADCAVQESQIVFAETIAKWRVVAKDDAAWRVLREESISVATKMKVEVRETLPGFWRAMAEWFMLRRRAHHDSDGQVPLIPGGDAQEAAPQPGLGRELVKHSLFAAAVRRDADLRFNLLRGALANPDVADLVIPRTVSSRGEPAKLTNIPKDPAADYAYRWTENPPPAEHALAPGQVGYLLKGCLEDAAPIRVERECSFGDLRFNYHTLEGSPTAPVIKASMPMDSGDMIDKLVGLSCTREPRVLTAHSLAPMGAVLAHVTSRVAIDNTVNVTLYFRDCGPTMRASVPSSTTHAEAASSDVSPAEQDRSVIPPDADCGPSPIIDAHGTQGRRAMAKDGWVILDKPHE